MYEEDENEWAKNYYEIIQIIKQVKPIKTTIYNVCMRNIKSDKTRVIVKKIFDGVKKNFIDG